MAVRTSGGSRLIGAIVARVEGDPGGFETSSILSAAGSSYMSRGVNEFSPRSSKGGHTDPEILPVESAEVKSF